MGYVTEEGVYSIPQEEYHADPVIEPSFSASIAHILREKTALHAWGEHPRLNPNYLRTVGEYLSFGELAHALMLGDERDVEIIDAANWKLKEHRDQRDNALRAGRIPALTKEFERAKAMVASGRRQIDMHDDVRGAFRGGQPEVTLIWREPVPERKTEVWCRCRLDYLHGANFVYRPAGIEGRAWQRLNLSCFERRGNSFPDFKTTNRSASPPAWTRSALFQHGNDLRAAFYARGITRLLGCVNPFYNFIVQETQPPYALSVIAPQYPVVDRANDQLDGFLDYWVWCRNRNFWPGYPRRTVFAELPKWMLYEYEERREFDRKRSLAEKDEEYQLGIAMQAPLEIDEIGDASDEPETDW